MMDAYKRSKKSYEKKLARAYYTSNQFKIDTMKAAGNVGVQMGIRQAVGFLMANIWFSIKDEFEKAELSWDLDLDLGAFFTAIGNGISIVVEKTMSMETVRKFLEGGVAGAISSITTTLCNIFFTTAKNVVRIIRQSWASIVQAATIILINPDDYLLGDRMLAASKVIATGASIVAGSLVSVALKGTPIGTIPVVGDVVQTFLGTLTTGVLSLGFLLYIDRSKIVNDLVSFLNSIDNGVEKSLAYYRQQAVYFENYAAKLMEIDADAFH